MEKPLSPKDEELKDKELKNKETPQKQILVWVGLGNPGREYANTRHNLGAMIIERVASLLNLSFKREGAFKTLVAKYREGGKVIHFLIPETYMNLSGDAVDRYVRFHGIPPEKICVVVDDVDTLFGQMKFKEGGGHLGHNGLRSITECLGTSLYPRLKVGILGSEREESVKNKGSLADFVLSPFSSSERELLPQVIERGALFVTEAIK